MKQAGSYLKFWNKQVPIWNFGLRKRQVPYVNSVWQVDGLVIGLDMWSLINFQLCPMWAHMLVREMSHTHQAQDTFMVIEEQKNIQKY